MKPPLRPPGGPPGPMPPPLLPSPPPPGGIPPPGGPPARLAEQLNDKEGKPIALGNIIIICQIKDDLVKALKYNKHALEIFKQIGAKREIEKVENNIRLIEEQIRKKSSHK